LPPRQDELQETAKDINVPVDETLDLFVLINFALL
jgi:hypothetical protein